VHLIALPVALVVSVICTPLVIRVLLGRDVMDVPSARSSHDRPIPRGGGVAVAVASVSALMFGWAITGTGNQALLVGALGFGLIGLADDVRSRSTVPRLVAQTVVAVASVALLWQHVSLSPSLLIITGAVAAVALVAFVNAFNFMDGINGISVAQSAVGGLAWMVIGLTADVDQLVIGGAALAGAALGFAPFNVPTAQVFLGDVGAYFLGATMGVLALIGLVEGLPPEAVIAPMLIYLLDTGTTLLWRVRNGEQWDQPHRQHVYQRLTDAGWSHVRTALFAAAIIGLCALLGGLTVGGSRTARVIADVGLVLAVFAYLDWPEDARSGPEPSVS